MNSYSKQKGFTIVELLIVIVVIGILAAITIVAYNGIQERGRVARAESDLNALVKAIQIARINTGSTLMQITGSGYSMGSGKTGMDNALNAISTASGANLSGLKAGDPWGNYYQLDENEKEINATDCRPDNIFVQNKSGLTKSISLSQSPCV